MRTIALLRTLTLVISDGQTGVDRAALDWAIDQGLAHGGWCTNDRRAEDGVIPARYNLDATDSHKYEARTRADIAGSDATLF